MGGGEGGGRKGREVGDIGAGSGREEICKMGENLSPQKECE